MRHIDAFRISFAAICACSVVQDPPGEVPVNHGVPQQGGPPVVRDPAPGVSVDRGADQDELAGEPTAAHLDSMLTVLADRGVQQDEAAAAVHDALQKSL